MTALLSPGGQHAAASDGFHTRAETVSFVSPPDIRLKRALGHRYTPFVSLDGGSWNDIVYAVCAAGSRKGERRFALCQ